MGRRGKRRILYLANTNGLFPPYRQNDTKNVIKFSRPCHMCSILSVQLFPPYHLSSILFVILLTVKVTVQIMPVTVHDAQSVAQRKIVFIAYCNFNFLQTQNQFCIIITAGNDRTGAIYKFIPTAVAVV